MTHRDRMLAVVRGERPDQIPWAPRMDLWLIALRERGALPPGWEDGLNTADIADRLGVACHAVRGDRTLPSRPQNRVLRGLGLDSHPDFPYRLELHDVAVDHRYDNENAVTTFHLPRGQVTTHWRITEDMKRRGISLPFVQSYAIEKPEDLDLVATLFERIEVVPTPEDYSAFRARIGDRGLAVAAGPVGASPMHLILHELMPMDRFFYAYADDPEALRRLAGRMDSVYEGILAAVLRCDAEVAYWGGNYDQNLTWPPFFQRELAPWLTRVSRQFHEAGKALLTHTDGENEALLPLYPPCGFDVAESLCPAPMTRLPLRSLREGFGDGVTIFGGVPSIVLMDSATDAAAFEKWLLGFGEELTRDPKRIIVGVADNVPPEANLDRLERVGRIVGQAGSPAVRQT